MNRLLDTIQTLGKGRVVIAGSFRPNGSSAVAAANNEGIGWSVARTNTGIFTVTLQDSFQALIAGFAMVALNAVADTQAQLGAVDVLTNKTVVINILTAGSGADIASHANNKVHFTLILRNTDLTQ